MKFLIQKAIVLTMLQLSFLLSAHGQTTAHLNDQAQAIKQRALAQTNRIKPANGNRLAPQVTLANRKEGCSINIGSDTSSASPRNRLAGRRLAPLQQNTIITGTQVYVCK